MKFNVIKARKTDYPNPITLKKGLKVQLGIDSNMTEWKNWIKCITEDNEGWVPIQLIEKQNKKFGIVLEDYNANELNIEINDIFISELEMNDWYYGFLENRPNTYGWVPKENVKLKT